MMTTTRRLTLLAIFLGLLSTATVRAEISLGHRGALAFGLEAKAEYDTNLNRNDDDDEDSIAVITPRVLYRYDQGAVFVDAFAGVQIRRYNDFTQYDAENIKTGISFRYPYQQADRNFSLEGSFGYNETTQADGDLAQVIQKETLAGELKGTYFFSDRYFAKAGGRVKDEVSKTDGFDDVRTVTVPLEFFYRYSEDLAFGLGYQIRDSKISGSPNPADSTTHSVYLAVEGQLTPTVGSSIRLGYQDRNFDLSQFEDQGSTLLEAELMWQPNERMRFAAMASNKYDITALNQSIEKLNGQASFDYRYDEKLNFKLTGGYEETDFSTLAMENVRNDEEFFGSIGADYELIEDRLSLKGLIYYSDRDSDQAGSTYDRAFFLLSFDLIY